VNLSFSFLRRHSFFVSARQRTKLPVFLRCKLIASAAFVSTFGPVFAEEFSPSIERQTAKIHVTYLPKTGDWCPKNKAAPFAYKMIGPRVIETEGNTPTRIKTRRGNELKSGLLPTAGDDGSPTPIVVENGVSGLFVADIQGCQYLSWIVARGHLSIVDDEGVAQVSEKIPKTNYRSREFGHGWLYYRVPFFESGIVGNVLRIKNHELSTTNYGSVDIGFTFGPLPKPEGENK